MQGIVLQKKALPDESALLDVLLENGVRKKIKLPGILKSKKRYAFFLTPASIWDFTLKEFYNISKTKYSKEVNKEILIPQESVFVQAPYKDSPTYQELLQISWLLLPISALCVGGENKNIFFYYQKILHGWEKLDEQEKILRVIYFSLLLLNEAGFLNTELICQACQSPLQNNDNYVFNRGGVCANCFSWEKENSIPFAYVNFFLQNFAQLTFESASLKLNFEHLEKILLQTEKHLQKIQSHIGVIQKGI